MIDKFCFRSQHAIPEFLSTHPSDVTRINQFEAWLPEAMQYYHGAGGGVAPAPAPYKPAIGPLPQHWLIRLHAKTHRYPEPSC